MKMHTASTLLVSCFIFTTTQYTLCSSHMIPEETPFTNRAVVCNTLSHSLEIETPPVVIVEMTKTTKKKEKVKKPKKNKFAAKKRPPPPANCIPLWEGCKSMGNVCCDFCAFCKCRLFKTVCYCRMGNPRC